MGYDPIVSGPEDMLREQMSQDAMSAREAVAANGTEVFQAVLKLRAQIAEIVLVVDEQTRILNELESRNSVMYQIPGSTVSVPGGSSQTVIDYLYVSGQAENRNAILSMSASYTSSNNTGPESVICRPTLESPWGVDISPMAVRCVQPAVGASGVSAVQIPTGPPQQIRIEHSLTNESSVATNITIDPIFVMVVFGSEY